MKKRLIILTILCCFFITCNKSDDDISIPIIETLSVDESNHIGVWVTGSLRKPQNGFIQDHGFVFYPYRYYYDKPDFNSVSKFTLGSSNQNSFTFEGVYAKDFVKDRKYAVRAFAKFNDQVYYGEEIEFVSHVESELNLSFKPDTVNIGDTISISGLYLNPRNWVDSIGFDNINVMPFAVSDTAMKAIVPQGLKKNQFKLKINVANTDVYTNNTLTINPPRIDSVSQSKVVSLNEIDIYGINFSTVGEVKIGGKSVNSYNYKMKIVSDSLLKIRIPREISSGELSTTFKYLDQEITYDGIFEGILPTIHSFYPKEVWYNDTLFIKGKNLTLVYNFNHPLTNHYNLNNTVFSRTDSLIKLIIKEPFSKGKIQAKYNDEIVYSEEDVQWLSPSINSISKHTIYAQDHLILYGRNFIRGMTIHIGDAKHYNMVMDSIKASFLPNAKAGEYNIRLSHEQNAFDTITNIKIKVLSPEIIDVNPKTFTRNQKIHISTKNINPEHNPEFSIANQSCEIIERIGDDFIIKYNPIEKMEGETKLTIKHGLASFTFNEELNLHDPWEYVGSTKFYGNAEYIGMWNEKPTLIDKGRRVMQFSPSNENWSVYSEINIPEYLITSAIHNDDLMLVYHNNKKQISSYSMLNKKLNVLDNSGIQNYLEEVYSFTFDNSFYIGSGTSLAKFDFEKQSWTAQSFPYENVDYSDPSICFVSNNTLYVMFTWAVSGGNEFKKFWKCNLETKKWTKLSNKIPDFREDRTSVFYNGNAYIIHEGANSKRGFHVYNPEQDKWTEYAPPPGIGNKYHTFIVDDYLYFACYDWKPNAYSTYKIHLNQLVSINNN
ncbi:Kelch repeat-containing protein [Marinifilum flexuosum]|uniref:IPT/TIG domain-containing protein n=1 Tax=Marinifilum flexuosum TaxID=1117708 RepID=A0A419X6H3_9BACT|nr:hypothetical protein [Marinifilum flexuosum]RKE03364.1 hypothetical protein BXY64_0361 [Marinifilum flexuosum]